MPLTEDWDLEAVYDERIFPLMAQIIAVCKEHGIPMIASFAYANDAEELHHCTTALAFDGRTIDRYEQARKIIYDSGLRTFVVTAKKEGRL